MSNEVKNRRALLKGIIAGSAVVSGSKALPEQWTKPLTDAVVLPGHAATTNKLGDQYAEDMGVGDDGAGDGLTGEPDYAGKYPLDSDYGEDDVGDYADNQPNDGGEDNPYS